MLVFALLNHNKNNVIIYYITLTHPTPQNVQKCYLSKLKMVPIYEIIFISIYFFHYIKYTFIMKTIKNITYYIHEHLSSVIYKS